MTITFPSICRLIAIGYTGGPDDWTSHASQDERDRLAHRANLDVLSWVEVDGDQAIAFVPKGQRDAGAIIVYPGSVGETDWFGPTGNLRAWPRTIEGTPGWWHAGFAGAYAQLWSWTMEVVKARRPPITLVGHSRGAGIAQIAAVDIVSRGHRLAEAHCVAAPRALWRSSIDETFEDRLPVTCYRIVGDGAFGWLRGGDPVCAIPPRFLRWTCVGEVRERVARGTVRPRHRMSSYIREFGGDAP